MNVEQTLFLGDFQNKQVDDELTTKANAISAELMSDEWLNQKGRKYSGRQVKIQTGVNLVQKMHKAPGGLIKATYEKRGDGIHDIAITGDFFCYPADVAAKLESHLEGTPSSELKKKIESFYGSANIETAGIQVSDWMMVFG